MPTECNERKRRRFQLRLSTMILFMAVVALTACWWQERRQMQAARRDELRERTERLLWEVKYKHLYLVADEILHLEHSGRPLEDYSVEELAELKQRLDREVPEALLTPGPPSPDVEMRLTFFRSLQQSGTSRGEFD